MFRYILLALAVSVPSVSFAQSVINCQGFQSSAWNIAEPWEENTRTFSNGNVRVALMDTVEPAAGAFYLLVLTPPWDEVGSRTCALVAGAEGSLGFAGLDFGSIDATYDPATGLMLKMTAQSYDPANGFFRDAQLNVIINQATGNVTAYFQTP